MSKFDVHVLTCSIFQDLQCCMYFLEELKLKERQKSNKMFRSDKIFVGGPVVAFTV